MKKKVYYVTDPHTSPLPIKIVLKHFALASYIIYILDGSQIVRRELTRK